MMLQKPDYLWRTLEVHHKLIHSHIHITKAIEVKREWNLFIGPPNDYIVTFLIKSKNVIKLSVCLFPFQISDIDFI